MCIVAMHWGFGMSNFWMLTIHQGRLLLEHKKYVGAFEYLQLPPALTVLVGITSAIGWLSIPVMLTAIIFIREKFNYSDQQFKKLAKIAFLSALASLILGFMIGKFVGLFTTVYTPEVETALASALAA